MRFPVTPRSVDRVRRAVLGWETGTTPLGGAAESKEVGMKYVIAWEVRENTSEETQARAYEVFGKWSPAEGNDFLQFLDRIDGRGGFAVVETEDPTLIAHDTAIFSPFLNFNVYPVLDSQEGTRIANEAIEFRRSIG
jgi:uncharacterized protein YeaC (DUF1315 family)